jgi:hypothetical protein
MELSAEDNLRMNVLLSQKLQAVRIDESKMIVYALTDRGEAKVPLNPNCKDEKYIKQIKAVLSTHVMGSPGGYPVFLNRWTRMGQARDESLHQLLMLGEPEAVVAAVHAPGLTDELAEKAWWAMPSAENARCMLQKRAVVEGQTGRKLADFLIEFLPFEEDQKAMIESVRLVLQPGLLDAQEIARLWSRAKSKRSYYVGFLHTLPDDLPNDLPGEAQPHPLYEATADALKRLADEGNLNAKALLRVLSASGQNFIRTAELALKKPNNQDVVESLLDAVAHYFSAIRPPAFSADNIDTICAEMDALSEDAAGEIGDITTQAPDLREQVRAMLVLSCLGVSLLNPVFARTNAIGSVMRKNIKHITDPVFEQFDRLLGR